jgi:hypothetical protein
MFEPSRLHAVFIVVSGDSVYFDDGGTLCRCCKR